MKRTLFLGLAALAALTITSCQKDTVLNSVPEQQPIGFGTYVGRDAQTKASEIDENVLKGTDAENPGTGFGVFAYYTGENTYTENQSSYAPNFMYNEEVSYDFNLDEYDYNPKKYWPGNDDKITFFAYAPYTNVNVSPSPSPTENIIEFSANTTQSDPTLSFTVASNVSNQKDLLYASALNQTTDDNSEEGVKFTFNHALSRIGFKAKPGNANDKIQVHKITLAGKFTKTGTCNLANGDITGDASDTEITYGLNFTESNLIYVTGANGTEITADEGYVMIIPTDEFDSTSDITVTVTYDLQVFDDALSNNYTAAAVNKVETGKIDGITFEKGKAYVFVLEISPSKPIKFSVQSVSDWDTDHDDDGDDDADKDVTVDSDNE